MYRLFFLDVQTTNLLEHLMQEEIYYEEATKIFGENWKQCPREQMSEQQFKQWWQETQQKPYKDYYYDVAVFIWDSYSSYITP